LKIEVDLMEYKIDAREGGADVFTKKTD